MFEVLGKMSEVREISKQEECDGNVCAVVNQLWARFFANSKKNIFQCTNTQFYSWLMTAQEVTFPLH